MSEQHDGGRPRGPGRTGAVLDPSFVEGLEGLELDELRHRRDAALAEREFQSYLRRLIQVRQDLLEAERDRRRTGGELQTVLERVKEALSEGRRGASRGEAVRVNLPPEDLEEADLRVDRIAGDLDAFDPEALSEDQLEAGLQVLVREERAVSADRTAVLRVHDRLQEELKRRYRQDPSQALR